MGESEDAGRPVAPAWLDAALVERALRAGGGGAGADTRVVGVRVEAANAAGDGYVSEMFRVRATLAGGAGGAGGEGGERRVVVKGPPVGERFRRLVLQSRTFVAEAQMFAQVVPKMERELEAVAPGRFPPFTARCLLWDTEPTHFLVLEDLAEGGFGLAERRTGMDAAHARLALRALARFHAASAAVLRREPAAMAAVANFFEQPVRDMFAKAARTSLRGTAAAMRRWAPHPGRWTALADALARRAPAAFDAFAAATCRVDPGDLAVVLHGDFWLNNMLFRRDAAQRPVDVRFVDLQLSHVGAPAADLLYFLYSSLDEETAAAPGAVDALLEEYRGALRDALQLLGLGAEAPTKERLQAAMDSRGAVALVAACCVLPITRCKTERVFDMEASLAAGEGEGEGDAAVEREAHLFCDAEYATMLRRVLPDFERRGWLQEEEMKDVYST